MDVSETGLLLEKISQRFPLGPAPSDIGTWRSATRDMHLEDALQAVTDLHGTSVPTVTPDVLVEAVAHLREYQMGPGRPEDVRRYERSAMVPTPPWTQEAGKASQRAAEACLARGLSWGHPITIASCREAALEVQREWEATYGQWAQVWRHWEDSPVAPAVPPAATPTPVPSGGRHRTQEESSW